MLTRDVDILQVSWLDSFCSTCIEDWVRSSSVGNPRPLSAHLQDGLVDRNVNSPVPSEPEMQLIL